MCLASSSVCMVLKFCSNCLADASVLMMLERFKVFSPVTRTFEKLTSLEKKPRGYPKNIIISINEERQRSISGFPAKLPKALLKAISGDEHG